MITIKEMANMLGVSTTTVSNVIHGKIGEVSQETVDRVQAIVKEYNYIPNINARNLASNQSKIIGVAILNNRKGYVNYLKDAFIGELVGCIEEELRFSGYYLMMCFATDAEELLQTVLSWNVDGLILFGVSGREYQAIKTHFKKPQVYIDSYLDDICQNAVNVGLADHRGGYLVGKYLIAHGHRKIGFVSDNDGGCDYERYKGMVEALSEVGISAGADHFIQMDVWNHSVEECCALIRQKVSDFTAFFCASDYYAMHLMYALAEGGIRVPEDVSIVGFDDNIYSRMSRPAITTIHQDPTEKGKQAVKCLLRQLETKEQMSDWIVLPVELVERDTVKTIAVHEKEGEGDM